MADNRIRSIVDAPPGTRAILQGNIAFAIGCARGGIHAVDGYPGTPSTEVIDKALVHVQDRLHVGWSINEANAVSLTFGCTMVGADAVVTMKIPGLFQAADVVSTVSQFTARRGGHVLYVSSDFAPSSTQHVIDPRYFLKSCSIPILEPRNHQEMARSAPLAARISREHRTPVVVLASGVLCHSEGIVDLDPVQTVERVEMGPDFSAFMNLPGIARRNYDTIVSQRLPGLRRFAEETPLNRIEWHDRSIGVVVHGACELFLSEVWNSLPRKPSILSLGLTFPVPREMIRKFAKEIDGPMLVIGDGLRFVEEEFAVLGVRTVPKADEDSSTDWDPEKVARALGATPQRARTAVTESDSSIPRPAAICGGCPYRAFGLAVAALKKKRKLVASFGDIGCYTLLHFMNALDTCACMGAGDAMRQGVTLIDPSLAHRTLSVIGDSTECHSGLDATRNAVFRKAAGVKVVLDNYTTAMTGGQPSPTSSSDIAGRPTQFDLDAALRAEGAEVVVVDAFDMKAVETSLNAALARAKEGAFVVMILRGECRHDLTSDQARADYELLPDACKLCDLCFICPGIEKDDQGYPRFTNQCDGCGEHEGVCVQRCNLDAFRIVEAGETGLILPPAVRLAPGGGAQDTLAAQIPGGLRVAVRGVGGQGNLFLGKVLSEVALSAGFDHVVKGETHGMAVLGGAVLSTFACGPDAFSPVPCTGTVDAVVALEESEVLRPGFLDLLKPDGVVLLNHHRMLPTGLDRSQYPTSQKIDELLSGRKVVRFDALAAAAELGDKAGRTENVIALGLLSMVGPFAQIPLSLWQKCLLTVSPGEAARNGNLAAFEKGRSLGTT